MKKYKIRRWIRRIIFFILIFGVVIGFKKGVIKVPDRVKSILIGTTCNVEYTEYYLDKKDEELEILKYEDFLVTTKGIKKDKCGGHSLKIEQNGDEYDVYVTDVLVNEISVEPYQGPMKVEDGIRLYDNILKKNTLISNINDISFTVGIRKSGNKNFEGYIVKNNVKIILSEETNTIDITELGETVYSGNEIKLWYIGKGKGSTSEMEAQYYLVYNSSDYDVQMEVDSVMKENVEILSEHEYGGNSGEIRGGHYGLACFETYDEQLSGTLKTKLKFQVEYHEDKMDLFGKEYRELWKYRNTFGSIDETDYIDINWINTELPVFWN